MKRTLLAVSACAFALSECEAATLLRGRETRLAALQDPPAVSCGSAPELPNSKPKNFADTKKTKYNSETKKDEPVVFNAGDKIEFKCEDGFTIDGTKDGEKTYFAECAEHGYFKPEGVCVEASKCGAVPNITHALPTGKTNRGAVEFACAQGYSLDGKKVVQGGFGKNRFFQLKCQDFSGSYEEFKGECKPYAFVPAKETIRIYNQVGEALFVVSCKSTIHEKFMMGFKEGEAPAELDAVCNSFEDASAQCSALVTEIRGHFDSQMAARDSMTDEEKKTFQLKDETTKFCTELWKLVELPGN